MLPPMICAGALNVGSASVSSSQQAAGVWMLVHEAFHLRHWRHRRNEAKVGCQTIVYFTDAAARLGATQAQAQLLYPYALALYLTEIDLSPWHRDPNCIVPPGSPIVPIAVLAFAATVDRIPPLERGPVAVLTLICGITLLAAPPASAYERPTLLERVATHFALRRAEVRCPTTAEWADDPIWGTAPNPPRA